MNSKKFNTADEYLKSFPKEISTILQTLRDTIRKAAPRAEEVISYNMPAFKQNGPLVYYAANKNHVGFYPTPSAIENFKKELSAYKSSKGAVQFPYKDPLPLALVSRIVKFRVKENENKKLKPNDFSA